MTFLVLFGGLGFIGFEVYTLVNPPLPWTELHADDLPEGVTAHRCPEGAKLRVLRYDADGSYANMFLGHVETLEAGCLVYKPDGAIDHIHGMTRNYAMDGSILAEQHNDASGELVGATKLFVHTTTTARYRYGACGGVKVSGPGGDETMTQYMMPCPYRTVPRTSYPDKPEVRL